MGRKGELEEYKRSNRRVRKGIPTRYRRCGETRTQRWDIQKRRIARKIYSKKAIWMVRQEVQSRILGKIGKELETVARKMSKEKKNENN